MVLPISIQRLLLLESLTSNQPSYVRYQPIPGSFCSVHGNSCILVITILLSICHLSPPDSHFPTQEGVRQRNMSPARESSHWDYEFHSPTALALPTSMSESPQPPSLGFGGHRRHSLERSCIAQGNFLFLSSLPQLCVMHWE